MAQIKVDHDGFTLTSTWRVVTGSNGVKGITEGPSTAANAITFDYGDKLPSGVKVKRARVHSTWGSPLSGYAVRTINGVTPDSEGMVDVEIDPVQTSVSVTFRFRANGNVTATGYRSASANVSEVYLLIETEGAGGYIYRAEGGKLVPYQMCRAEGGKLVPYRLCRAEGGKLVPY